MAAAVILLLTAAARHGKGPREAALHQALIQALIKDTETTVAKPEWGTKRLCPNCGTRYYDMRHDPIVCPHCGTTFDPEALLKTRRTRVAAVADNTEDETESDVVAEEGAEAEEGEDSDLVVETGDGEDEEAEETEGEDEEEEVLEDASELGEDDDDMAEVIENVDDEDE